MITEKDIKEEEKIPLLIVALQSLNLVPATGYGEVEIVFRDGKLLDTASTTRTKLNMKLDSLTI